MLGAAAAVASLDRGTDPGDLIYFVHRGGLLLSADWADTFADPVLQSGPLQLALFGAVRNFTALAYVIEVGVAGLLLFVLGRLGVRDRLRLGVGLFAVAAGLTHGAFIDGHPRRRSRRCSGCSPASRRATIAVRAGGLVGLSAGLELWGVLGAPVLLLVPRFRRALLAGLTEAAVVTAMLVPFVVAGTFRMFEHEWHVSTGTFMSLFVEPGASFGWPLRLMQSTLALATSAVIALVLRKSLHAVWLAPLVVVIVRLLLDPLSFGWYWLGAEALVLVGAALLLMALPTRFPAARLGRGVRVSGTGQLLSLRRVPDPDDRTDDRRLTEEQASATCAALRPWRPPMALRAARSGASSSCANGWRRRKSSASSASRSKSSARKPPPSGGFGQHAEAVSFGERQDVAFVCAVEQAVLVLQDAATSPNGECPLDRLGGMLEMPPWRTFPFADQPPQLAPRLLDRRLRVDVVDLHQVQAVGLEPRRLASTSARMLSGRRSIREPLSSGNVPHFVKSRTSSRRPEIARATTSSARPQP